MGAICIAAPSSGSGKTTLSLGIMAALVKRGLKVQPFKCGPDYVDTEYHQLAAKRKSRNLDTWLMGAEGVINTFQKNSADADMAVIEGVMGLYDGPSSESMEGSTAHVAKLLSVPVILVIDARKIAGSIAPLVKGFSEFHPDVKVAGVIANKISGPAHCDILSGALRAHNLPPLLGCMPSNSSWSIDERHLGLLPLFENTGYAEWLEGLSVEIEKNIDMDTLVKISETSVPPMISRRDALTAARRKMRVGLAFDEAFHFYYQDNIELLEENNIEIVKFSPLRDASLPPDLNGLYIGGGYPEIFASELSANPSMLADIRKRAKDGLPVYAECGGLMYLSSAITDKAGKKYDMCGVLPCDTCMKDKLQSFGYKELKTLHDSILGPAGTSYRGHEFHWSCIENCSSENLRKAALSSRPFKDAAPEEKGFIINNVYASYIHAHFKSNPDIAFNIYKFLSASGG